MNRNLRSLLLLLLGLSLQSSAQYVTLSPGFGNFNGFGYSNLQALPGTTIAQRAVSAMVQPDGKMIVACESTSTGMLLRLNEDGTPDLSFGVAGKAVVHAGVLMKAILQPDGKILIGIGNTGDFTLVRYNNNGTPDLSFGNRGIAILQAGYQSSLLVNMVLQPDGKIVAVGFGDYFVAGLGYNLIDAAVARFTANGQPDISFDGDGKRLVPVQASSDCAQGVDIDLSDPAYPTGKIVIGGYAGPGSGRRLFTARLLPDGSLDNSYGTGGLVEDNYTNNGYFSEIKVLPNGKILAGGCAYNSSTYTFDLLLVKYNADGSRDNSFSGDGLTINPSGTSTTAAPVMAMQLLAGDKLIVASGRAGGSAGSNFALSRYNADGSLDNSFDGDGVLPAIFASTNFDDVKSLTVDNNGRYVIAGESMANYGKTSLGVSRYNYNGSIDISFSEDGKYVANFPGSIDNGRHIIRQPDGKLLVAATVVRRTDAAPVQSISEYVILRYHPNGSLDDTWGTNGTKFTGMLVAGENIRLALQPDGKVLMVGNTGSSFNVTVARFTTVGAADPTFDGDGKITFTALAGYSLSAPSALGVTSTGQIVISCVATYNSIGEIALIRLNANGSLDNTYGSAGLATVGLGMPVSMLMLSNDKLLLTVTNNPQGNLKRILPTGYADASFGTNGTVNILTPVNSAPQLLALSTDAAGNVLVAGTGNMGAAGTQGLLARVTTAGVRDAGFGVNGVVMTDIVPGTDELFNSVSVQPNGNIVVAGTIRRAYYDMDILLARFSPAGVRDLTLNNNIGYFSTDLQTGSWDQVNSFVPGGGMLYGTGNIRTDQAADLLLLAIDMDAAVLPVSFSSFYARKDNAKATLTWTTSLEQNLQHYLVERSGNGLHFQALATVAVKTGNSTGNSYHYTDEQPLAGTNYYRIRSVDQDNSTATTVIRSVNFDASPGLKIYPNPAQNDLQVVLQNNISFPVPLKIYDITGRTVYVTKATQAYNKINIRHLLPGIYYVLAGDALQQSFLKN